MPHLHRLHELPREWRQLASYLEAYAPGAVRALEQCAAELEEAMDERESELLNLQQAAAESGYTADHLGRLVREGKIPNAGRKHAPRIRRADLPLKSGTLSSSPPEAHLQPAGKRQIARSIADEMEVSDG